MHPLEEKIGYQFKNKKLLELALAHPSLAQADNLSNQRLEFLGDAVLQLCVSAHLYQEFPHLQEGQLSRKRALMVQEQALKQTAQNIDLGQYLRLGPGEEQTGGRDKPSILADAVEALLGAVYLDGGLACADQIVISQVLKLPPVPETRDFKTDLQELTQRITGNTPAYRIIEESGPAHDRQFTAEVSLNGEPIGTGAGSSKKAAEQAAAHAAMESLAKQKEFL